jgi:cytochrome P450 / NADPH-cytochrome P450 reductase
VPTSPIPRFGRHRLPLYGDIGGPTRGIGAFEMLPAFSARTPLVSRSIFGRYLLLAGRYDVVADLADDTRFAKFVGPALQHVRPLAGDGLFTAYNEEPNWARAHGILMPAFALDEIESYHPTMLGVADELVAAWDAHASAGRPVDVAADMTSLTLDTIGRAGFGYGFDSFRRDSPHPFITAMVGSLTHAQAKLRRPPGVDRLYRRADAQAAAHVETVNDVIDGVLRARRESGDTRTDDLLGRMLNSAHPESGERLDDRNIRHQVITFLIAGHETTSGALSFALYGLVKNPAVLARATAEVDALWGAADDPRPSHADVGELRYVRQVIDEALRLWPTAPAFGRTALADTVVGGRYALAKGQSVLTIVPALHRDPVWGDNVEAFDPDRFTPERRAARPVHAYKPFGTGERACIGSRFALHEATLVLGLLLHRYAVDDHTNYALRIKQTLTVKPDGFGLTLRRRTPAERAPAAAREQITVTSTATALRAPGTPLTVLHGSNLGTARRWARRLAERAEEAGFAARTGALDSAAGALPTDGPVLIVAASYNGQPTDDAAAFVDWLEEQPAGAWSGVRYAVLGIGDRNWSATYQRVPTLIDEGLAAAGAHRLADRGAADASIDLALGAQPWIDATLDALLAVHGEPTEAPAAAAAAGYRVHPVRGDAPARLRERDDLEPLTVVENAELVDTAHPLGRSKRMVRLKLPAEASYRTGDQLVVRPENPPEMVARAAAAFDLDPDAVVSVEAPGVREPVVPAGQPLSVRELLTHAVELQDAAGPDVVRLLAERNPCPPEAQALRALVDEPPAASVLELAETHPALRTVLPLEVLLELLPPLRTRIYSISSAAAAAPDTVELLVSVLGSGSFRGLASNHLAGLPSGATVHAALRPCRDAFRVDPRAAEPTVLVAAGSGLAPFRGVIADRVHARAAGASLAPARLYFGCDHPDVDYLHRAELEAARAAGAVDLRPAFSRAPEHDCRFVQHRMLREGPELWGLLEAGARVLVCGDARGLAPGVRATMLQIHQDATGGEAGDSEEWFTQLQRDRRYVEDVYAG